MGLWSMCARSAAASARPAAVPWHRLSLLTLAAWAPGFVFAAVDGCLRDGGRFRWSEHALGTLILTAATAGAIGLALFAYLFVEAGCFRSVARAKPGRIRFCQGALRGAVAMFLAYPTARFTFSGNGVRDTLLGTLGPPLMAAGLGAVGFICSIAFSDLYERRQLSTSRSTPPWREEPKATRPGPTPSRLHDLSLAIGRSRSSLADWVNRDGKGDDGCQSRLRVGAGLGLLTGALLTIDLTVYPFLYAPLHTLLEVTAGACILTAALALWPRGWLAVGTPAATLLTLSSLLATTALVAPFGVNETVDRWLAHTWLEELYVGRSVRRLGEFRAHLAGQENFDWARRAELLTRFNITDTSLDVRWQQPTEVEHPAALAQVENIAVFYVDTLRDDVTRDHQLMPRLAQFRAQSLDFTQAYAVGSDTLRSLPALTSGTQFIQHDSGGDLLSLARNSGLESVLVSAASAAEFLQRLRPEFAFERVERIADTQPGEPAWGYGATRPTARRIVDGALAYLDSLPAEQSFFLWLLHFDQHAWRELSDPQIDALSQRLPPSGDGQLDPRYRAVAASVDEQFGRFLDGLEASGRNNRTAVLFVSDHGEGLGQEGFWVHSVFLWDSLLHVPLVLRVPGLDGRVVDTPVSLVDVAPTLAPILGAETAIYHGESLLGLATTKTAASFRRRYPIVLRSAYADSLSRIGVIEPETNHKFVLRLRALFPELYDLTADHLDQENLAPTEPEEVSRLLRLLARSPVFPRAPEDFWLLGSRGPLRAFELSARTLP